jgi:hypothetical protein
MAGLVRRFVVLAGATVVLLGTAAGIADGATGSWMTAGRAAATGTWGKASEVPGTAALNAGGLAQITEMSCAATGNCSAGGEYVDGSSHRQVFVVSEVGGHWGMAMEVPGFAALNAGGLAQISGMSCASAGNCSAGGDYTDSTGHGQVFVVSEAGGRWGNAKEVPGVAILNTEGDASVQSVSCASAGNCSAGGFYTDSSDRYQAFVVSQSAR